MPLDVLAVHAVLIGVSAECNLVYHQTISNEEVQKSKGHR
jgi:Na+/H+ antiporter NhaB